MANPETATGLEGLYRAECDRPDAILLDISMPDLDGFEIFAQLQQNPQTQTIPVIVLTSKVLARDRARFEALAIAGTITKPFNPLTLGHDIAALLQWDI